MKIVVIGGTGLIGKKLVTKLRQNGHEVVAGLTSVLSSSVLISRYMRKGFSFDCR